MCKRVLILKGKRMSETVEILFGEKVSFVTELGEGGAVKLIRKLLHVSLRKI